MPAQPTMRERLHRVAEARDALRRRVQEAREVGLDDEVGAGSDTIVVLREPSVAEQIPSPMRSAAAWSWRFLVVVGAIVVVALAAWNLRLIVFPVVAALLLTALLSPAVRRLRGWGLPRALAAGLVFVGGLAVVVGVFTLLAQLLASQFGDISTNVKDGLDEVKNWLATGPLSLSEDQIKEYSDDLSRFVTDNRGSLAGGAIATATAAFEIVTGTLLALFTTFFFLYDGERIWTWCARLFPRSAERPVLEAGRRAWRVLTNYVRATLVIAAVDAIGIAIVLAVVGVPLAAPLGVLVFFGAFIPIAGATVTGAVAVLVALVTKGTVAAFIILAGVIAIQQLEGHIMQPLIMGRFIRIHPLAVVLSVAVGAVVAGIPGAVVAVPLTAVLNTVLSYFASLHRSSAPAQPPAAADVQTEAPERAEPAEAPVTPSSSTVPAAPSIG